MKILFLLERLSIGGIQKVTVILANKFVKESHDVSIYCFSHSSKDLFNEIDSYVKVYFGDGRRKICDNIKAIRKIVKENDIDVVVNQNGLSIFFFSAMYFACRNTKVKTISVYHNAPNFSGGVQDVCLKIDRSNGIFRKGILSIRKSILETYNSFMMKLAYKCSDRYMLLSKNFIPIFKDFTNIKDTGKIIIQTNPITLCGNICIDVEREKTFLYVGRFDESQKKVSRILELWSLLELELPEWKLILVGDGPQKDEYINYVNQNRLNRVLFEGFQNPLPYYVKSTILLLTSDFEGFGLVIPEGMSCGVVPIVLGSYDAVYDIIEDGRNGFIMECPFRVEEWRDKIINFVKSPQLVLQMSNQAKRDSKLFEIDNIYLSWMDHLKKLITSEH